MLSKLDIRVRRLRHKSSGNNPEARRNHLKDGYATFGLHSMWGDRRRMTDTAQIAIRMADDAASFIHERGADAVITVDDFLGQGWTIDQVRRCGHTAVALVESEGGAHASAT